MRMRSSGSRVADACLWEIGAAAHNREQLDPHDRHVAIDSVDRRRGVLASEHFQVSGDGNSVLVAWARQVPGDRALGIEAS